MIIDTISMELRLSNNKVVETPEGMLQYSKNLVTITLSPRPVLEGSVSNTILRRGSLSFYPFDLGS